LELKGVLIAQKSPFLPLFLSVGGADYIAKVPPTVSPTVSPTPFYERNEHFSDRSSTPVLATSKQAAGMAI